MMNALDIQERRLSSKHTLLGEEDHLAINQQEARRVKVPRKYD